MKTKNWTRKSGLGISVAAVAILGAVPSIMVGCSGNDDPEIRDVMVCSTVKNCEQFEGSLAGNVRLMVTAQTNKTGRDPDNAGEENFDVPRTTVFDQTTKINAVPGSPVCVNFNLTVKAASKWGNASVDSGYYAKDLTLESLGYTPLDRDGKQVWLDSAGKPTTSVDAKGNIVALSADGKSMVPTGEIAKLLAPNGKITSIDFAGHSADVVFDCKNPYQDGPEAQLNRIILKKMLQHGGHIMNDDRRADARRSEDVRKSLQNNAGPAEEPKRDATNSNVEL